MLCAVCTYPWHAFIPRYAFIPSKYLIHKREHIPLRWENLQKLVDFAGHSQSISYPWPGANCLDDSPCPEECLNATAAACCFSGQIYLARREGWSKRLTNGPSSRADGSNLRSVGSKIEDGLVLLWKAIFEILCWPEWWYQGNAL